MPHILILYPFFSGVLLGLHFSALSNNRNENQILIMHFLAATQFWPKCGPKFFFFFCFVGVSTATQRKGISSTLLLCVPRGEFSFVKFFLHLLLLFTCSPKNISMCGCLICCYFCYCCCSRSAIENLPKVENIMALFVHILSYILYI